MLTELEELQESDEEIWGSTSMSFTIETRMEESDEIVERTYTFTHAEEWDKWMFQEFEEKRTDDTETVAGRNWRRTRHILWNDVNETPTIDVPPEVGQKLKEATNAENVTIQTP